jgi:hypothetical protein
MLTLQRVVPPVAPLASLTVTINTSPTETPMNLFSVHWTAAAERTSVEEAIATAELGRTVPLEHAPTTFIRAYIVHDPNKEALEAVGRLHEALHARGMSLLWKRFRPGRMAFWILSRVQVAQPPSPPVNKHWRSMLG